MYYWENFYDFYEFLIYIYLVQTTNWTVEILITYRLISIQKMINYNSE